MKKGKNPLIENLRLYRLEKQLTYQELANRLKVTRMCLWRWFNYRQSPRDLERYRVEKLLKGRVSR